MRWIVCPVLLTIAALQGCSSAASTAGADSAPAGAPKKQSQSKVKDPLASLTLMRQGAVLHLGL